MKGKIYKIVEEDVLFAYRGENQDYYFHYICIVDDEVVVWCFGGVGKLLKEENYTIVEANEYELIIWNSRLESEGYKWNTANCVLMDLNGNIFNQE